TGITEPVCGQCGYCVRGLAGMICPECGSDLREVGILTPGAARPISKLGRVVVWTLIAPPMGMLVGSLLAPWIAPMDLLTTERRTIFSHSTYCSTTVEVEREGKKFVLGYPRGPAPPAPAPPQTM